MGLLYIYPLKGHVELTSPLFSTISDYNKKMAIYGPGSRSSPDTEATDWHLDLGLQSLGP